MSGVRSSCEMRAEELRLDAVGLLRAVALLAGAVDEVAVERGGGEQEGMRISDGDDHHDQPPTVTDRT